MQKTDDQIENKLIWRARRNNLPSKSSFYFRDLSPEIKKYLSDQIDLATSGNPVLFFTRPTKEWTLICTRQVICNDTNKIFKLNLSDIEEILPTEFDPRIPGYLEVFKTVKKKAEWNEIKIIDRQNRSYILYADSGSDLFALWNILLMAIRMI
jgi:hypothetical protein